MTPTHTPTSSRPHPQLNIPPGARPPAIVSPQNSWTPFSFELNDQARNSSDSFHYSSDGHDHLTPVSSVPMASPRQDPSRLYTNTYHSEGMQRPRSTSSFSPQNATYAFPEPHIHYTTSVSARTTQGPYLTRPTFLGHRQSKSDIGPTSPVETSPYSSVASFSSSTFAADPSTEATSEETGTVSLESDEGLLQFQAGRIPEKDQSWYRFVPPQAQEALGKHEVERQSAIFELFTAEKDYVDDLALIREVFIDGLKNAEPPIIESRERLKGFIKEVFWNLTSILTHHERMLGSLFARQREQHPLIQSVADIILDNALLFMPEYESYIKHSPISLERHRKELKRNPLYEGFIHRCFNHPRIRKRDLKTLLSRPVTRLPRLRLLLERILKVTEVEHEDLEEIPIVMGVLGDLIKSTQPGIEVAEGKVRFWDICESLVYSRGEIIDMDLYDDSRTLTHSGSVSRRVGDSWHNWSELLFALFDNYLLILKEEIRPTGTIKRLIVSRPIPVEYLRLGSFSDPSTTRSKRTEPGSGGGSLLGGPSGSFLSNLAGGSSNRQDIYPFTVWHAAARTTRKYTVYVGSENQRRKWKEALVDAIGVRKVRQEANMWFAPQVVNDGFFREISLRVSTQPGTFFTGRVSCAAHFYSGGRSFIAVGTANGIFVGLFGSSTYRKALSFPSVPSIFALQDFNRLLIHVDSSLLSLPLDSLAQVALSNVDEISPRGTSSLSKRLERVAGSEGKLLFVRVGMMSGRTVVIYAVKTFLQVTIWALEPVQRHELTATTSTSSGTTGASRHKRSPSGFRSFGSPQSFVAPRDAYDVVFLSKNIGVCTEKGIIIVNPTNFSSTVNAIVPDFSDAQQNMPMYALKSRADKSRVLGLVRIDATELLAIYEDIGCYIRRHGEPSRHSGYIRWESKITSYALRGTHILLFSSDFIEIRHLATGRLVQVMEGKEIRLLNTGGPLSGQQGQEQANEGVLLVAMKGEKDDGLGASQKVVEIVKTREIARTPTPATGNQEVLWDDWDLA